MKCDPLELIEPKRVALIKPSALGDVVHALPVLAALRTHWPKAHITWIINRGYEPLIVGHPDLDATMPFDRGAYGSNWIRSSLAALSFWRRLRAARFDLVIDLQGLLRTGLMSWAIGAAHRIGFANAREGAPKFYTHGIEVPDADEIHAVDRYWRIVEALGAGNSPKQFHVPLPENAKTQAQAIVVRLPRPVISMAVGARWLTKRWPAENFAAAAQYATSRFGGTIVMVGGKEDAPLAKTVLDRIDQRTRNENLCGKTSLPVLAAVLNECDLVIANDTGPLHLAAALGRPVIAPYTCTQVRKHGPYGQQHRTISATVACHGSYVRTCDHLSCMPTVPAERVFPLIDEVLSRWVRRRSA